MSNMAYMKTPPRSEMHHGEAKRMKLIANDKCNARHIRRSELDSLKPFAFDGLPETIGPYFSLPTSKKRRIHGIDDTLIGDTVIRDTLIPVASSAHIAGNPDTTPLDMLSMVAILDEFPAVNSSNSNNLGEMDENPEKTKELRIGGRYWARWNERAYLTEVIEFPIPNSTQEKATIRKEMKLGKVAVKYIDSANTSHAFEWDSFYANELRPHNSLNFKDT